MSSAQDTVVLMSFRLARKRRNEDGMVEQSLHVATQAFVSAALASGDPLGDATIDMRRRISDELVEEGWRIGAVEQFLSAAQDAAVDALLARERLRAG